MRGGGAYGTEAGASRRGHGTVRKQKYGNGRTHRSRHDGSHGSRDNDGSDGARKRRGQRSRLTPRRILDAFLGTLGGLMDPSLRGAGRSATLTEVIDKVLTSTPRLLAIANLLLAFTYLLHNVVAAWFLGGGRDMGANTSGASGATLSLPSTRLTQSTRERLGGYLLFKLLLISAVVDPDTLDLLILLSWYTLLSFLRSLAHLAGSTTSHTAQSGTPPHRGVFRLLVAVLVCDFCAAGLCAALFHTAGWGTVLLLTCDCALLAVDVQAHIARHAGQVLEEAHGAVVSDLEGRQLRLAGSRAFDDPDQEGAGEDRNGHGSLRGLRGGEGGVTGLVHRRDSTSDPSSRSEHLDFIHDLSRSFDRRIEMHEARQTRRLGILDLAIFGLELVAYVLAICHFLHIWSLHGVSFGLVDGVLALHLHSAVSAMGRKIAERKNLNRIARELNSRFSNATEIELRKSSEAGDVCCICLGTMSGIGSVKKVGCGHLYHTHCLREVIERANSIESAKCPLCRATMVDSSQSGARDSNADQLQEQQGAPHQPQGQAPPPAPTADQALFSFSTEGFLPTWIPIPAFSFEVIRRPSVSVGAANNQTEVQQQHQNFNEGPEVEIALEQQHPVEAQQHPQQERTFWRRLLTLAGAIPMSSEEETAAIEQLVDMFPQFERHDLLRELRLRGSAEGVAESVLLGIFSGVARGGGRATIVSGIGAPPGDHSLFNEDDNSILDDEGSASLQEFSGERNAQQTALG